ncbi:MAG: sigma-70 family RNA polymerase sigma factor [Myxococcota bacterium]
MNEAESPESQAGVSTGGRHGDLVPLEEERAVIERLQAGDRDAFATLYGWYGDLIWRQAILPRLPIRELAEDCLRDTFRTALEKIGSFRIENRSIFFWLRRIAVNKAIDIHRRHKRDHALTEAVMAEPADLQAQPAQPDRGLEVDDTKRLVGLSLDKLNERYAQALKLRLIEERTREECAAILDVTVGNFDVILHRAIKAFRKVYPP